ncbi:MAG TPA: hypothetical protein VF172_07450 [Nitrososphaera sp.]|jgi:hypothetical protein
MFEDRAAEERRETKLKSGLCSRGLHSENNKQGANNMNGADPAELGWFSLAQARQIGLRPTWILASSVFYSIGCRIALNYSSSGRKALAGATGETFGLLMIFLAQWARSILPSDITA